jgi:hypothetical protein
LLLLRRNRIELSEDDAREEGQGQMNDY